MPHGKICYLEIPANRAEDSAEFYSSIFGWKVRPRGDGNLAFDDSGSVSGTWVKESDRTPDEVLENWIVRSIDRRLRWGLRALQAGRSLCCRRRLGQR